MKLKRYLGIGLLLAALLLLGQMMLRDKKEVIAASPTKNKVAPPAPANPQLQQFLANYEKEIEILIKASTSPPHPAVLPSLFPASRPDPKLPFS